MRNINVGKINEVVETAFKRNYTSTVVDESPEYTLVKIGNTLNSISYIIINNDDKSVLVEFIVSSTSIFDAKSHGNLLSSKYELYNWYNFFKDVNSALREGQYDYEL